MAEQRSFFSVDVATGEEKKLAQGEFWGWSFSPDGRRIVFARAHGLSPENFGFEKFDLFVTDSNGGDTEQITDTGDSAYPVWGPKSIAFAKLISHRGWGRHEIWQIQPDGSGLETITGPLPERFLGKGLPV